MPLFRPKLRHYNRKHLTALLGLHLAIAAPSVGDATADQARLCTDAAAVAARQSGVPLKVLLAVTLAETGRNARPWPWTVNVGGNGQWLATEEEAAALAEAALASGVTNLDLGCFQLNHRWHSAGFASVRDMLDPVANATYAAGFLAHHHALTGDWIDAAAAYHSATPEFAARYRARFIKALASLDGTLPDPRDPVRQPGRENRFPLLLAGQGGKGGSLVPQGSGGKPLIGAP